MAYLKKNFKSLSSQMHNLPKTPAKGTPEDYLPFRLPIGGHKNLSIDLSTANPRPSASSLTAWWTDAHLQAIISTWHHCWG